MSSSKLSFIPEEAEEALSHASNSKIANTDRRLVGRNKSNSKKIVLDPKKDKEEDDDIKGFMKPKRVLTAQEAITKRIIDEQTENSNTLREEAKEYLNKLVTENAMASPKREKYHHEIYGKIDDLNAKELMAASAKNYVQTERDYQGRYHRYCIAHPHPIPGTQLRLEKEKQMGIEARIRLMNERIDKIRTNMDGNAEARNKRILEKQRLFRSTLEKADHAQFMLDRVSTMLDERTDILEDHLARRETRLVQRVGTQEMLEKFWGLLETGKKSAVKLLLIDRIFQDINVAISKDHEGNIKSTATSNCDLAYTPLMFACQVLYDDIVEILLQHHAEPSLATAHGDTAMHFLWRNWSPKLNAKKPTITFTFRALKVSKIIALLLKFKADANAHNIYGESALHHCCRLGLQEAAMLLVQSQADPFRKDRHGKSSLDYAHENGFEELHRNLLNYAPIQRMRNECAKTAHSTQLLKKRGDLSREISQPMDALLIKLRNDQRRAGHTRGQFLSQSGQVLLEKGEEDDEKELF